jgi:hypothetical protein
MRRDCQSPHPLDEHRVLIDWGKPRAGAKVSARSVDRSTAADPMPHPI